jgi:hypothetical protein
LIEYLKEDSLDQNYAQTYSAIVSNFKKVEFALNQMETLEKWRTPQYISDGLNWLSSTLHATTEIPLILNALATEGAQ